MGPSGRIAALVLGLAFQSAGCEQRPPPPESETTVEVKVLETMTRVRDNYRDILLLVHDEHTLSVEEQAQVTLTGRYLFESNLTRIELLTGELTEEMDRAAVDRFRSLPKLMAFLDELENGASWRDADKLVFQGTMQDLADHLSALGPETPAGRSLLLRIEDDIRALDEILAGYNDELKEIFEKLDTRAMAVTREKWDDYIAFLRKGSSAKAILDKNKSITAGAEPIEVPAEPTRSGEAVVGDFELTDWLISGNELPDKTLILTFDDGPHGTHTPKILDILDSFNTKAVFFEVGRSVGRKGKSGTKMRKQSRTAARVVKDGHLLATHTQTHPMLTRLGESEIREELETSKQMLDKASGANVILFRPPFGAMGKKVKQAAKSLGLRTVMWNIDSRDWADPVPRSIARRVIQQTETKGRGILLFHDIHGRTVAALPLVLETLIEKGYRFVLWDGRTIPGPETEEEAPSKTAVSRLYRGSHALVVGINDYDSWPRLNYAVSDARAMAEMLTGDFGFPEENVHLMLDKEATRENIMAVLGGALSDPRKVGERDRVMVFFAGHGTTRTLPSGRSLGYIIPVDADRTVYQSRAISMTEFQDINEAIPAGHVFYMMDACYGGQVLLRGGTGGHAPDKYLKEVTKRKVRQVLTAGGAEEQVSDNGPNGHSVFTWTVLEGLRGKADLNGDQHITATELFAHVAPVVSSISKQTPAFGSLVGSEGGEFVFELPVEEEFLTDQSSQLDEEAIALNSEIEKIQRQIQDKLRRNEGLKTELAAVTAQLDALNVRGDSTEAVASETPTGAKGARKLRSLGMSLFREKRYEEAIEAYRQSLEIQPNISHAANNLGYVYYANGDLDAAMEWYSRALEIEPDRAVAFFNIAELHEKRSETKEAMAAYKKFLELAPEHKLSKRVRKALERLGAAQ